MGLLWLLSLREYLEEDGISPFGDWPTRLDAAVAAKVTVVLGRIGQVELFGWPKAEQFGWPPGAKACWRFG